jgi:hypothetical protein
MWSPNTLSNYEQIVDSAQTGRLYRQCWGTTPPEGNYIRPCSKLFVLPGTGKSVMTKCPLNISDDLRLVIEALSVAGVKCLVGCMIAEWVWCGLHPIQDLSLAIRILLFASYEMVSLYYWWRAPWLSRMKSRTIVGLIEWNSSDRLEIMEKKP